MKTPHGWTWGLLDLRGDEAGRTGPFGTREDAESWLSAAWEDLAGQDVAAVALRAPDDVEVYRMSLSEPS